MADYEGTLVSCFIRLPAIVKRKQAFRPERTNERPGQKRTIEAGRLKIKQQFVSNEHVAIVARNREKIQREREEFLGTVLVMERADRSL